MSTRGSRWRIGVDTGGTFTDLVAVCDDGRTLLRKVSSTPSEPSAAVLSAFDTAGRDEHEALDRFVLGTTIATNAVIQRKGAPVILLTTAGFEDVLYIQRIDRPGAYDLQWVKSVPFALRRNTLGVKERILADGSVYLPLEEAELDRAVARVADLMHKLPDASIAICLLFAYLNSSHERRLADVLRANFPDVPISISSEVAPIWREYERSSTTVMDAYVHSVVDSFVDGLRDGLAERRSADRAALLKSNGGQVPLDSATDRPVDFVLSGLSGGMIGGHFWARQLGTQKAVTLDMGGTSADVGVVIDGQLQFSSTYEVEWGVPVAIPIIDVTTIGAGGSSIATVDPGGMLRVGPESAGADPGPAAYGKGGREATVTDANLVIGRLDPADYLGGELTLDVQRSRAAVQVIADRLGLGLEDAAEAIIAVSVENMAGAVRLVTVDRGHDYRDFDLVAFGGAGALHAAEIASRLGIRRVIIPPAPGLVSAFGALIADERIDRRMTLVQRLDREDGELSAALMALAQDVARELALQTGRDAEEVEVHTYVSCRYVGQNYEQEIRTYTGRLDKSFEFAIPVELEDDDLVGRLLRGFHEAHERSYGYSMRDQRVESVYLGATALIPSSPALLQPYDGRPAVRKGQLYAGGKGWESARFIERNGLRVGDRISGPAVVIETTSTTYIPNGFEAEVDATYCLLLTRRGDLRDAQESAPPLNEGGDR